MAVRDIAADPRASREEVLAHRNAIAHLARELGLTDVRIQQDGTLVVHSGEPGYRSVLRLSHKATDEVGLYVHVITDDVPAAKGAKEL